MLREDGDPERARYVGSSVKFYYKSNIASLGNLYLIHILKMKLSSI